MKKSNALILLIVCISVLSFGTLTPVAYAKYEYIRDADFEARKYSSTELADMLGTDYSDDEKAYIDSNCSISLSVSDRIPESCADVEIIGNTYTVRAREYSDEAAGKTVTWEPEEATVNGVAKPLDDDGCAEFEEEGTVGKISIKYFSTLKVEKDDANGIINKTYDDIKFYSDNDLEEYNSSLVIYNEYLNDLEEYGRRLSEYNEYLERKEAYDEYLEKLDDFSEQVAAYQEYLAALNIYNSIDHSEYLAKMSRITYQLGCMEYLRNSCRMIGHEDEPPLALYSTILGNTVTSVLERKSELVALGVPGECIDRASDATQAFRKIMLEYFSLESDEDKYAYYITNYIAIKRESEELLRCLEKLLRTGMVSRVAESRGKKNRFILLQSKLLLFCTAIDTGKIYNYEAYNKESGTGNLSKINAALLDRSTTFDGLDCSKVVPVDSFLEAKSSEYTIRVAGGYPEDVTSHIPPEPVEMPVAPETVTRPEEINSPVPPEEIQNPFNHLFDECDALRTDGALVARLAEAYRAGTLKKRTEYSDDAEIRVTTVLDKYLSEEYMHSERLYEIKFSVGDETHTRFFKYGQTPFLEETLLKIPPEGNVRYLFTGFDREITPVEGNTVYTAEFEVAEIIRQGSIVADESVATVSCGENENIQNVLEEYGDRRITFLRDGGETEYSVSFDSETVGRLIRAGVSSVGLARRDPYGYRVTLNNADGELSNNYDCEVVIKGEYPEGMVEAECGGVPIGSIETGGSRIRLSVQSSKTFTIRKYHKIHLNQGSYGIVLSGETKEKNGIFYGLAGGRIDIRINGEIEGKRCSVYAVKMNQEEIASSDGCIIMPDCEAIIGTVMFDVVYTSRFIVDGMVIKTVESSFGETPVFPADPIKASDKTHSYVFREWLKTEEGYLTTYVAAFDVRESDIPKTEDKPSTLLIGGGIAAAAFIGVAIALFLIINRKKRV